MSDCPHHSKLIDIVEHILFVYEQNYPILPSQVFIPNSLNSLDRNVNSLLKYGSQLVILTWHG